MYMRTRLSILALVFAFTGCGGDSDHSGAYVSDQRIIYSDGLHNENTEMISLADRILLIFRGGEMGQVGSSRARIKVFGSTDNGRTFTLQSEVNASNLPEPTFASKMSPSLRLVTQSSITWTVGCNSVGNPSRIIAPARLVRYHHCQSL